MWTLGRLVDSQKQEIKKLQSQLGREKERCSRAREVAKVRELHTWVYQTRLLQMLALYATRCI